ncbi:MAG: hypothetical protein ACD_52C00026G0008 [uncultured bacterium]|uniref:Uncharacterized protein n=1 Tax=Candidatus Woesebacteria bacterium RIFCSPHIGHO2_12_FULL_41_24 TaxID=1802510 RepID=A0A1F8AU11_9BACT|nr:MAG: hypothetical protein ACD_52C00026G0008 [uncultured bacterium]OGM14158.1 MAG: hypothetical protein A2W15_03765 [Candidatus Woesebacteria bacterium RBG_16_41_13]OGM28557.1 MAG: hypothetical protein A2873_02855 [Candidatus Woesebacteria bacterium RIFCSPHIGHO2_01_FULL_42_80]OGM35621.1 MAG: hypothetical protein A3D84_03615 [Candidatus Woesebacteria bacterium RIFCSPHIGHO2_02_FULL_42_20]OGM55232.1 MAG: hypothetical protein A3E44_03025 [Candidatus Woesebacteria bacterium RIFCSPHIGHO2_12_FULL_41
MGDQLKPIIDDSRSILLLLPVNPTFDQVAGGLGMYLSLKGSKEVSIACESPMTVEHNRLVGVNKISSEIGDKNLVIRFKNYHANNIERVSYDIENGEFRLTVIPKPKNAAPMREHVHLNYSGVAASTMLLVGGSHEDQFPMLKASEVTGLKKVHIGVRSISLTGSQNILSLARVASSVSELIARLLRESGFSIDADVATNLLMGIEEETRNFTTPEVSAETFEVVSVLMRSGGARKPKNLPDARFFPPGAIPGEKLHPVEEVEKNEIPKAWMEKPPVYKGTSIS